MKLKDMKGEEFVKKILEGERDFSRIKLEEFELNHYYDLSKQLHEYLYNYFGAYLSWLDGAKDSFKKEPIIISESLFIGFKAGDHHNRLYLPFVRGEKVSFYGSDLDDAVFSEGELEKSHFEKTRMRNISFCGANLKGARFEDTDLAGASFWRADLSEAYLWDAILEKADFGRAQLQNVKLQGANARGARFTDANLENAGMSEARLSSANLENANLKGATLDGTGFYNANLKGVKGLKETKHLEHAIFDKTKVTLKERTIIKEALSKRKYLFIEDYE